MTTSRYISLNLPDDLNITDTSNIIARINDYLVTVGVTNTHLNHSIPQTTTTTPTTTPSASVTTTQSASVTTTTPIYEEMDDEVSTTETPQYNTGIFGGLTPSRFLAVFKSLTLDELITILVLLLNIDLDKDGTPDVFQLIKGIKDYIYGNPEYDINTDDELNNEIQNNTNSNSNNELSDNAQAVLNQNSQLFERSRILSDLFNSRERQQYGHHQRYQRYRDWELQLQDRAERRAAEEPRRPSESEDKYTQEITRLREQLLEKQQSASETSFNSSFVPGYAYTNPQFWESEKSPPPVCIADKYSIKSPALVLWDGLASNALNIQKNILPEFTYAEKTARQQEMDSFEDNKRRHCNNYCSDNCNNELCHALECPKCRR